MQLIPDGQRLNGGQTAMNGYDSTEELEELLPDEVYIIGAIVDRNRYKNLTFEKAEAQSIRHARLPIGKYLNSLPSRKVLTVNQVFEIMLKWRKFVQGGKKSKGSKGISDEQEGEQEDAESGAEEELIGQQEQTEEALKY
ncbi:guanine-1-methyltransferase-domain-containing protein [Rhodocollybia butyracea]|uniref:tRNA (guanine(9)-N1)-methyltransferase n=1 Tax=Rhodocollybia butyracea TaxID=206335 RepID=A0A9P5PF93_9AGAR|nr:guanine-1-methyltransferase-domain-containing protein [Rhodocollybia butyracea]